MMQRFRMLSFACAVALSAGTTAVAQPAATSAPAPSQAQTANFTNFIGDVLAGRVPSGISETMRSQSSSLSQVKTALAPLGAFAHLKFLREDSLQGYHRYHYAAVFAKGTQDVAFVTDSNGVIVGFFADQPPPRASGAQTPAPPRR